MKVAITDYTFPNLDIETGVLQATGHEVVASREKLPLEQLISLVADADAVITQFATLNAELIDQLKRCRVIVRYGIGVDNVDLAAARSRGIPVCNVPDYCIDEVADHTLAFILATTRQVIQNTTHVRDGKWGLATPLEQLRTLRDLTVGIVGFGRIGREVAARLRPFKPRILVHDPVVVDSTVIHAGLTPASWTQVLRESDLITLHCPSTAETRGLINAESLSRAKPGLILINLARGDLVDSQSLTQALINGQVAAAALDVFAPEPIPANHPILKMPNVILASHIASASVPAVRTLRETAAGLALLALEGRPLKNIVNGVNR